MKTLLIFLLVSSVFCGPATFSLVLLDQAAKYENAACLDGSSPAYYFRPGFGDGENKWFIFQEGGGWCYSLDECVDRSKTTLGSSKTYPSTMDMDDYYFKTDASVNPLYNYNYVYMKYCDGASFSGMLSHPIEHQGTKLYMRGRYNFDAVVTDLVRARSLFNATEIVLGGCSAGGLATWLHIDRFAQWMKAGNPSVKVYGLPDSGFFPEYEGSMKYESNMEWVFTTQNASAGVNGECLLAHKDQPSLCMFAENNAPFVTTPTLVLQSSFDAWDVPNDLGVSDAPSVNAWGQSRNAKLLKFLQDKPQHALFLDSCYHHCFFDSGYGSTITIDGTTMFTALKQWQSGSTTKREWFADQVYPCDKCCQAPTFFH